MADQTADRVVVELEARSTNYLSRMRAARRDFDGYMNSMGASAERMERRVSAANERMSSNIRSAIAAIAVGAVIKDAQQLADTWTQTGNKLAAAGVQASDLAGRQQQLIDLAIDTRTAYSQTADIYARVTRSTQELNATDAQRLRLTELINKSVKAGGATTAEQISTITQLGQALASGNLQGDELRSIRENAPLLARALAAEFETTVGGLKELGAEGEITSDRIVKAILNAGGSIDASFARTRSTIGETFTALETSATQFIGNFDKALGVTEGVTAFTQSITEDFDLMAQAVIIAAAVAGGAIVGKLTVPLQQAAVTNAQFVRSLFQGTTALQLQGQQYRNVALQASVKAQAERDAARAAVVATQQRINQLRQEAAQYQQNIALANAQRAAVAKQAAGRDSRGRFVSSGESAQAIAARNAATKARIASSMQLKRVEDELIVTEQRLTAQNAALSTSLVRVAAASSGVSAAIARTSLMANAGAIAMKGLGVAMSFFGGPIGIAIMAVAGALVYFATEAAKAEAAAGNLRSTLDETEQQAGETRQKTDQLATSQKEGARASADAASKARDSSNAYDAIAKSAADAAEMVKYLTSAQRQQRLEKLDEQINDARRAREGNNPFTTNDRERLTNQQRDFVSRALGSSQGRAVRYDNTGAIMDRARAVANAPNADPELKEALQRYDLAVRTFNEEGEDIQRAIAEREVILKNVNAPTLERPDPVTSNLTAPVGGDDDDGKGGKGGRKQKEETAEELAARREIYELEQRLNLQRAAGADTLAQFTQDELDRRRMIKELEDQKFTTEEAEDAASRYIAELRVAREVAAQRERDDEARKQAEEQREAAAEKAKERQAQINFLAEQDLLLQRELARLAGDSERVKELDKILDRMQRIRALVEQGGMSPEAAANRADNDQGALDQAEMQGDIKEVVFTPIKDALLEAFRGGDWSDAFGDAIEQKAAEGLENALNTVYDLLAESISSMFKDAVGGSGSGGLNIGDLFKNVGSFFGFGGGRAGGGLMKPGMVYNFEENGRERIMVGSTARVLPNRVESAAAGGNGKAPDINLSVVNATGVPARATVERDETGGAQVRLEPLIDQGIKSAGRRGVLDKGNQMSPRPRRRG